jgi:predicted hotdog family 3-hydroxylacyl-ACP dehydratase
MTAGIRATVGKDIDREELETLLPHRGKMFLLSRVLEYDLEKKILNAQYDVTRSCIFYDPDIDGIPSWVSFEFMAQSISAFLGIEIRIRGETPKTGFILSVSNFEAPAPEIKNGTTVTIAIIEECRMEPVCTFKCTAYIGDREISSARVTVMDVKDPSLFIMGNHGN